MFVAWIRYEIERGAIIVSPHQGAKDGPTEPYFTPCRDGRGPHGALLPPRRRLRSSQPPCPLLRIHKAPLGLGSRNSSPSPSSSSCEAWKANALSCARPKGSSLTCSPGVVGLHPSSFHRRVRKLRRFLEPLRRDVL